MVRLDVPSSCHSTAFLPTVIAREGTHRPRVICREALAECSQPSWVSIRYSRPIRRADDTVTSPDTASRQPPCRSNARRQLCSPSSREPELKHTVRLIAGVQGATRSKRVWQWMSDSIRRVWGRSNSTRSGPGSRFCEAPPRRLGSCRWLPCPEHQWGTWTDPAHREVS